MKYKERHSDCLSECRSGLKVFDGKGNEFVVSLNGIGELLVTSMEGSLRIEPSYSNQIILHTEE